MKYILAPLLLCQAAAFSVAPQQSTQTRLFAGDYEPMEGEGKINLKFDLDSPKVATMAEIEKGKKIYCRCWLSGTWPLCDATHVKHNEATGDNVGPLIVTVKKGE
jgi:CDGSH-type Zn-finger protein